MATHGVAAGAVLQCVQEMEALHRATVQGLAQAGGMLSSNPSLIDATLTRLAALEHLTGVLPRLQRQTKVRSSSSGEEAAACSKCLGLSSFCSLGQHSF